MVRPNIARWRLSIESCRRPSCEGIGGIYKTYSLKDVKQIVDKMRKMGVTPPVDKTMPITTWLLLYGFIKFEAAYGSGDRMLTSIKVEETRSR